MARMSDFSLDNSKWNVALCGPGGSGKSTMASTFPGTKVVFDFDDKMAAYLGTDTIYHTFLDRKPEYPEAHKMAEMLIGKVLANSGGVYVGKDGELFNESGFPLDEDDGELVKPSIYILDSATGLEGVSMNRALDDDPRKKSPAGGPAKHHFNYQMTRTLQILSAFKAIPTHRLVTFHFEVMTIYKDGVAIDTHYYPLVTGKTKFRLHKEFGEWYHMFTEREGESTVHRILTHSAGNETAITTIGFDKIKRVHIFDDVEEPDFPHLMEKVRRYYED